MKHVILLLFIAFGSYNIVAQESQSIDDQWNAQISSIVNTAKGAWDGVVGFAKGMAQSVGYVSVR